MECTFIEKCPFFKGTLKDLPATAESWRTSYCRRDFAKCARFKVRAALGPGTVPDTLYPNMGTAAQQLIEHGG
jgi:hypothetical protein